MHNAYIVGWGHTAFGKLDQVDLEQLLRDAVQPALASAGLEPGDIDGIFVGHFNAGFVGQDFTAALPAVAMPEFRHTPSMRTENACATGSAAIWAALDALAAGRMRRALVIGMEKMNELQLQWRNEANPAEDGYLTLLSGPAHPYHRHFNPAWGLNLGYDDLKVIEMYNFLSGVVSGKQGEPGFTEALAVANVQQAIIRSWESSRWETVTA